MGNGMSVEVPGGGSEGYQVLKVQPNSPGALSGLEPFFDYILSINDNRLVCVCVSLSLSLSVSLCLCLCVCVFIAACCLDRFATPQKKAIAAHRSCLALPYPPHGDTHTPMPESKRFAAAASRWQQADVVLHGTCVRRVMGCMWR